MWQTIRTKLRWEDGATAVEYGIMVALIAVVITGAVFALGTNLSTRFQDTADCVESAGPCEEGEEVEEGGT